MSPAVQDILLRPPFNPLRLPGLAAAYDARTGVTADSTNRVSAWADLSGKGRPLVQGTGANQPLWLPYSGNNYLHLPGVVGNYASTPDSPAASVTADIDLRIRCTILNASTFPMVFAKDPNNGTQCSYRVRSLNGPFRFSFSLDGTTYQNVDSTAGAALGAPTWLRVTRDSTTGEVIFYTSQNGTNWTQLGNAIIAAAGAINDSTAGIELGSAQLGAAIPMEGAIYGFEIRNGIDGPIVAKFDAQQAANNATSFVSSTGETWTINKSGARPAQIVGSARMLFDGTNYFQKSAAFTLGQPVTIYLLGQPITYTSGDYLCDGDGKDTLVIEQLGTTPTIDLYAGNAGPSSSAATLATWHVIAAVFNGASSLLQVNNGTPATGDAGTATAGGFTLMAAADGSGRANYLVERVLIYNTAHDARTRARIYDYLRRNSNLSLP
jgi:hypothetical protein